MQSVIMGGGASAPASFKLIDILTFLGLDSGLECCLDAGDAASYSGTGATWNDVSGLARHFTRGGTDPVFNGAAGSLGSTNYWTGLDVGYFFIDSLSLWTNFHKSGGKMTVMCTQLYQATGGAGDSCFFSIHPAADERGDDGFKCMIDDSGNFLNYDTTNSANNATTYDGNHTNLVDNTTHMFGWSLDDAALEVKTRQDTEVRTGVKIASSNTRTPDSEKYIGQDAVGGDEMALDTRLYCFALWNRALTNSEWTSLYTQSKLRWTALP